MKTLTEFKNQNIQEDGHTDVPSAMRSLKVMSESISEIETALSSMSGEDSLESWWMNKINSAKERLEALTRKLHQVSNERRDSNQRRCNQYVANHLQKEKRNEYQVCIWDRGSY